MSDLTAEWRKDLKFSRDVDAFDKGGFEMLLSWFERWRVGRNLEEDRSSTERFWREEVKSKERLPWQLK